MRALILDEIGHLSWSDAASHDPAPDEALLSVEACAICRTDAKMWQQGHRDLALPRVLGHELYGTRANDTRRYVPWPGTSCGTCAYCRSGRENLCDTMRILGFHLDGGFADSVRVPRSSLLCMPEGIPRYLGCFAEPMGCVLNAFEKMGLNPGDRLLVYGGGTLGMLFAMVSSKRKIRPVVIEQDERKAARCRAFLEAIGTISCPTTAECNFDGAVNACGASEAFGMAILKTRKSGTVCFFSGLAKETSTDAGILNLAHYRELRIAGTYGLTRRHLKEALELIPSCARHLELLVEDVISLADVPHIMPEVLSGKRFKYIIDMQTPDPTGSIGHFPGSR